MGGEGETYSDGDPGDGLSCNAANPKYRRFKSGDNVLEYTLNGSQITIDWVSGNNASTMMKLILSVDGNGIAKVSGYVTDKLGSASDAVLQRLADQIARQVGSEWNASIETIEGRRYLVFMK